MGRVVPKVYIVGAGPGDPELLSLKAYRLLLAAEVVVFDRLVGPEIMDLIPPSAERVDVGKADGVHTVEQERINEILVEKWLAGNNVIRLKGGDPFVFGRGAEEIETLRSKGIPFEIVPGISSSTAVAAYAGIPMTLRGVSCSFAVVTGHECPSKPESEIPWKSLAGIGTLVFLMGVKNRVAIARKLLAAGRPSEEPVAIIERGTTPWQKTTVLTLGELEFSQDLSVRSPAVLIVGRVVDCRETLQWFPEGMRGVEDGDERIDIGAKANSERGPAGYSAGSHPLFNDCPTTRC